MAEPTQEPTQDPAQDPAQEPPTQEPPTQKPQESKPAPPAPEFHVVKQGFVQRQGHLLKSWHRQWMTLDEGGASLRWYKSDTRAGKDGTLYMSKCAEVCDPREGINTTWPEGMEGRCFVVCSPNRAHYIIAESVEDKAEWVAKLTKAKNVFNTTGVGIVSVDLFSVEAIKVSFTAEMERAQRETDTALAAEGTSTEQIGKSLDKAAQDAEKELKSDQTVQQVVTETEQATEQVESEVKIEASASGDTGAPGDILEGQVEVQVTTNVEVKEEAPVDEGAGKEE